MECSKERMEYCPRASQFRLGGFFFIYIFTLAKIVLFMLWFLSMAVNAEVTKNEGESAVNMIRRFSKRVQGTGLIQGTRKRRYAVRTKSANVRRKQTLKVIKRRENVKELIKLGKMQERAPRGFRRR